ncbi:MULTISPECIES: sulfite exporter TauE/SafE family protein [unclassified Thioalkalivibrio]|uniref:sulfite exporter TauE/SafE family protein n=1 Tax=unclassified Thioalkalivibrio TaxID=2621013 RepID=UPI00035D01BF|nr:MULTISPECIES: sulfite exporter TauE/SafE family protein [unclassified Thioalkalivibrio]
MDFDVSGLALLLLAAGFFAGLLNAVAGGGSFLTLPALMSVGVPPVAANATGTAALLPGYLASVLVDRRRLREAWVGLGGRLAWALLLAGMFGGAIGAAILLLTGDARFRALIPWLLLLATLLFALEPWLQRQAARAQPGPLRVMGAGLGCAYGGYFNGGVGILLLAILRGQGVVDLARANAVKNLLSSVLTLMAVVVYVAGGQVVATGLLAVGAGAILGARLGIVLVRRLPEAGYRHAVTAIGAAITVLFFLDPAWLAPPGL